MHNIKHPSALLLSVIIVVSLVLDQFTKWYATQHLVFAEPVAVLPFLNWMLLHNPGAAFGFLSDAGGWQHWFFVSVAVISSLVFFVWMLRTPKDQGLLRYSLALVISGAIGNLIDRVQLGHVVDFISVHWQSQYFFPAFNVADSAITLGAILLILDLLLQKEAKP